MPRIVVARKAKRRNQVHLDGQPWRVLAAKFKAYHKARNSPCWYAAHGKCLLDGMPIDYDLPGQGGPNAFEADHYKPRTTHPHLTLVWGNLRPSHCTCNRTHQHRSNSVVAQRDWVKPKW